MNFPDLGGASDPFKVFTIGLDLGTFLPGDRLDFVDAVGQAVDSFAIVSTNPNAGSGPHVLHLSLGSDSGPAASGSFFVQNLVLAQQVPEPASFWGFVVVGLAAAGYFTLRPKA